MGERRISSKRQRSEVSGEDNETAIRNRPSAKACLACRSVKVRCVGADNPPCERCVKMGSTCEPASSERGKAGVRNKDVQRQLDLLSQRFDNLERIVQAAIRQTSPSVERMAASAAHDSLVGVGVEIANLNRSTGHVPNRGPYTSRILSTVEDRSAQTSSDVLSDSSIMDRMLPPPVFTHASVMDRMIPPPVEPHVRDKIGGYRGDSSTIAPPNLTPPSMWISEAAMEECFVIFYRYFHRWCGVMEFSVQTAKQVAATSPLLLATVCAVAAPFYAADKGLRWSLPAVVNDHVQYALRYGVRSIEVVQSLLILSTWNHASYECHRMADRSSFFLNNAISMARDLRYDVTWCGSSMDPIEKQRATLCVRVWLMCHLRDQLLAHQLTRTPLLAEDALCRQDLSFYALDCCPAVLVYKLHRESEVAINMFVERGATGVTGSLDPLVLRHIDRFTEAWTQEAKQVHEKFERSSIVPAEWRWLTSMYNFHRHFVSMHVHCYALHCALERGNSIEIITIITKCGEHALAALLVLIESCDDEDLRYSIDDIFTFATLCVCMLLKLTRPALAIYTTPKARRQGLAIIPHLVAKLDGAATDEHHTAAIYALYIRRFRAQADLWIAREDKEAVQETEHTGLGDSASSQAITTPNVTEFPQTDDFWTAAFIENFVDSFIAGDTASLQAGALRPTYDLSNTEALDLSLSTYMR